MRRIPDLAKVTSLVARALGMTPDELLASFRPARAEDLPRIAELRRAELEASHAWDDTAYLAWRYRFGGSGGRGDCWLLERGTELLAMIGTEDVTLEGARGTCLVVCLMDILVKSAVRGVAIGPWINLVLLARYECVAAFGSNDNSRGMVSSQFAEQLELRTYSFYLRCNQVLRRRLDLPLITPALAGVGNLVLRAWRALHLHRDPQVSVAPVTNMAELSDSLAHWQYAAGEVGRRRDGAFLEWRAMRNPRSDFRVIGAWRDGRLQAYLVVREIDAPDEGRELRLLDWFAAPRDSGTALRTLVIATLEEGAARGLNVVTVSLLHEQSERMYTALGFLLRPPDQKAFFYTSRAPHPLASGGPFQWRVTMLDGDVD